VGFVVSRLPVRGLNLELVSAGTDTVSHRPWLVWPAAAGVAARRGHVCVRYPADPPRVHGPKRGVLGRDDG